MAKSERDSEPSAMTEKRPALTGGAVDDEPALVDKAGTEGFEPVG